MVPKKFSMTANLEYDAESMEAFIQLLEGVVDFLSPDSSVRFFLKIAVNELVVNAVEHGYDKNGGPVSVRIQKNRNTIALEVSDLGKGVRWDSLNLEKSILSMEDLTERGWGLSILKKVSSRMNIKENQPSGTIISVTMPLYYPQKIS